MKEKVKCKKCGLLIDDDMQYCPYCGYVQDQNENQNEEKENKDEPFIQTSINPNLPKERGNNVFAFESKVLDLPLWKKIASFLLGTLKSILETYNLVFQIQMLIVIRTIVNIRYLHQYLKFH